MNLRVSWTTKFKNDYKKAIKQHKDIKKLDEVIRKLAKCEKLEPKYRDHQLTGNLKDIRECHIEPDWLLMYKIEKERLILTLTRTGSHSELKLN